MKNTRSKTVGGPDGISFEEHIREVEAYINRQDPWTLLYERLNRQIRDQGVAALATEEAYFYTVSNLMMCVMGSGIIEYIRETSPAERTITAAALSAYGFDDLRDRLVALCDRHGKGDLLPDQDDVETEAFVLLVPEVDAVLDERVSALTEEAPESVRH